MSLKDLLPPGTFDEIVSSAHTNEQSLSANQGAEDTEKTQVIMVSCPYCHKKVAYSKDNPFRPFCSEKCKLLDLGAWANEERTVAGNDVNMDEDADLLNDPNLPVRNIPQDQ